jgi:hypothetical protein
MGQRNGSPVLELGDLTAAIINVLDKPIARIRETCEMAGASARLDRALPELEAYLEDEAANGKSAKPG